MVSTYGGVHHFLTPNFSLLFLFFFPEQLICGIVQYDGTRTHGEYGMVVGTLQTIFATAQTQMDQTQSKTPVVVGHP